MGDLTPPLTVDTAFIDGSCFLTAAGSLDGRTDLTLRDTVISAALDEPTAVLVNVENLCVPVVSAWTALSSARWHVSHWPDVPIMVVCAQPSVAVTLSRHGVSRSVPVYPSVDAALRTLGDGAPPRRRRASATLSASTPALHRSRVLVAEWLTGWGRGDLVPVAKVIVDGFVENVLAHTDSRPVVLAETDGATVTVAVEDTARPPAVRREPPQAPHHCVPRTAA